MKLTDQQLKQLKDYFSKQPDIVAVYVYGSFATGNTHPKSDLDLGILFDKPTHSLTGTSQIDSGLSELNLPTKNLDIREIHIDLEPVYLRNVVQGSPIYSGNNIKRIRFEVAAIRKFRNTEHLRKIRSDYMYQRIKEGSYGTGSANFN